MALNCDEIEAVLAVVEAGGFRAAALKLHKSQSAISYIIKNIENNLKIKVFDRDGQQTKLTDAGQIIYNKALVLNKINKEIQAFSNSIAGGVETKIKLVVSAVTPNNLLMEIFKEFNAQFPKTQLELIFKTFEEPLELLLAGEADIVITAGNQQSPELERAKWNQIEFIPVTTPYHEAANPDLSEEELYNLTHLVVGGRSTLAKKAPATIVENANVWNVTDFLIKKELLANGLGWGYMPRDLINRELREGILIQVPSKEKLLKQLDLVRKKSDYHGQASNKLWEMFLLYSNNVNPKAMQPSTASMTPSPKISLTHIASYGV